MASRDAGGDDPLTEEEFESSLRTFTALWDAKADLERQLGDERRRTEKLRNQISEQVVAQEGLKEDLRAAQRTNEKQGKRAERDRETIHTLEQRLAEAQAKAGDRERSCQRCAELEAKARGLEHENGQLKRAASELEALRAYGKQLQGLDSASQVPSLAAHGGTSLPAGRSPAPLASRADRLGSPAVAASAAVDGAEHDAGSSAGSSAGSLSRGGAANAGSRLKLSKKHRSDQFESLGSVQQDDELHDAPLPSIQPRKKRCVSPTFDETEQQLSQASQPSQPSQPAVDTPALFGEGSDDDDDDDDNAPTSRWEDGDEATERREGSQSMAGRSLPPEESQLLETAAQEDSMADLLNEIVTEPPRRSDPKEKENTLPPPSSASSFNVSTPRSSAVDHGCAEPAAAASAAAAAAAGDGAASPVPATLPTTQTQNSPDLFPDEDGGGQDSRSSSASEAKGGAAGATGSSKFKTKLRARTPFTQSQRS
jgi:hypothetical protein